MCISHFVSCRGRLCASYGGLTVEFMVNGLPVQTATGDGTLVNIVSQRQTTMSEGCRALPTCSSCCVFSTVVSFQFNTCIWTGLVGVLPSSTVTRTREFNLTKRKDIEHAVEKINSSVILLVYYRWRLKLQQYCLDSDKFTKTSAKFVRTHILLFRNDSQEKLRILE